MKLNHGSPARSTSSGPCGIITSGRRRAHRIYFPHRFSDSGEYWFPKVAAFYPEAPEGKLLGGAEYNHIGSDAFGPLKDDLSAYCPPHLTHAKREKKCVSVQEHVWGTDGLAKLEAIKEKIDPQGLFQCQKCVGFKGPVRDQ